MPFRTLTVILAALCLAACASAPKPVATGIETEKTLRPLRDEAYATSERFVDAPRVQAATSVGLPQVRIGEGAVGEGITPAQAALVANRAARDTCQQLARRYRIDPETPDLEIEIVVTAIAPTSSGAAGASAVLGVFVPGPFRLPAGLGGLAADGAVRCAPGARTWWYCAGPRGRERSPRTRRCRASATPTSSPAISPTTSPRR